MPRAAPMPFPRVRSAYPLWSIMPEQDAVYHLGSFGEGSPRLLTPIVGAVFELDHHAFGVFNAPDLTVHGRERVEIKIPDYWPAHTRDRFVRTMEALGAGGFSEQQACVILQTAPTEEQVLRGFTGVFIEHPLRVVPPYSVELSEHFGSISLGNLEIDLSGPVPSPGPVETPLGHHASEDAATEPPSPLECDLKSRVGQLASEKEDLERQLYCVVCMERPRAVLFFPCRHLVCCQDCAVQLLARPARRKCPVCRTALQQVVTAIRS